VRAHVEELISKMARADTLLTGSIVAMIAIALLFDDEDGPPSAPDDSDEPDTELTEAARPRRSR